MRPSPGCARSSSNSDERLREEQSDSDERLREEHSDSDLTSGNQPGAAQRCPNNQAQ